MAWSRLMMFPRRVPFIGAVPLPMISSCPRSLISPTSAQTFEVPMSRATMYFSSVRGMRGLQLFDDHSIRESQIRVVDARVVFGAQDSVEAAPLGGDVGGVGVDECAEVAVEEREAARRNRTHFGDARVELAVARAQFFQQRNAARELAAPCVGDQRQLVV